MNLGKPGKFIVFDGPDKTGKTTQVKRVSDALKEKGFTVYNSFEPGGTPLGMDLRKILMNAEYNITPEIQAMLFTINRYHHCKEIIKPKLNKHDYVICDRYLLSSMVYQGIVGKVGRQSVKAMHNNMPLIIKPDWTFLFDISLDDYLSRKTNEKDRFETGDSKVAKEVIDGFKKYHTGYNKTTVVDAIKSMAEVTNFIVEDIISRN
jgi:dTMP kinase